MTPLHIPETPAEYRYNMAHSATHNVIERTFRTIRSRFRCLDGSKGTLQYSPEKSSHIILACCVLHNISLEHGLDVWSSPATGHVEQPEEEYEQTRKPVVFARSFYLRTLASVVTGGGLQQVI